MHQLALVRIETFNTGEFRLVQLANGTDEEVGFHGILRAKLSVFAAFDADVDVPFLGCVVPVRGFDGAVEADIAVEFVFLGDANEVALSELVCGPNSQ